MKTYDVFLSHSTRQDADTTTENTMTMVYALLKDRGIRLFWDRKSLSAGQPLIPTLSKAISASRLLVTFLSPIAAESSWVEFECEQARLNTVPIRAVLRSGQTCPRGFVPSELIHAPDPFAEEGTAWMVCSEVLRLLKSL